MRRALLFVPILALGALVLLGRAPTRNSAPKPEPAVPAPSETRAAAVAPVPQEFPAREARELNCYVAVDALDGSMLELEPEAYLPGVREPIRISTEARFRPDAFPPSTLLRYVLADGEEYEAAFPARPALSLSGAWLLPLPYSCRLAWNAEQAAREGAQAAELWVLRPGRSGEADRGHAPFSGAGEPELDGRSAAWLQLRSDDAHALAHWQGLDPARPFGSVAASGPAVIVADFPDGRSGYAEVELTPGAIVEFRLEMRARPIFSGVLLDWEGNPAARERLWIVSALDGREFDLRPSDPHGIASMRMNGVSNRAAMRRLRTDDEGRFRVPVPEGADYAIYSHARGGYAFWSTREHPEGVLGVSDLELRLEAPDAETAATISLLRPDGTPLLGATVEIAICDDAPFFRQWPTGMPVDERGELVVHGLRNGDRVGLFVNHQDLGDGIYSQAGLYLGPARRLEIMVPEDRLLASVPR